MAPYHFDAADPAELRAGRVFVHRSRDPWTDGPVYARVVTWNLDRIAFDEIRRYPGRPDELVRWNVPLEEFFAKALDRWHESDAPLRPRPPPAATACPSTHAATTTDARLAAGAPRHRARVDGSLGGPWQSSPRTCRRMCPRS